MFDYPLILEPDEGTVLVTCPDIPGMITYGETEAEALHHAVGALSAMIMGYWDAGEPVPYPSPANGRPTVRLPAMLAAKVTLQRALAASGLTQSALAERLGIDEKQIRRLLDPNVPTRKIEDLERALEALGKRLRLEVEDLPAAA